MTLKPLNRKSIALIAGSAAAVAAVSVVLIVSIFERRQEAQHPFAPVVTLTEQTEDPAVWGQNFPDQYASYLRTVDQTRTRYGGSEAVHRVSSATDPRTQVAQSRLDEDPRLKTIWAGYAFSEDFREERGHAYMLTDQEFTRRQTVVKQPGTCIHCHASTVKAMRELGQGDLHAGFTRLNSMPYSEARSHVRFPVACIDCHDPGTTRLRVTRPAFMTGMRAFKASQGVADYDVNRDATPQEMRTFVCAQCHVEYYFQGPEKRLTYPWSKGQLADQILAYYDEIQFKDWQHSLTGAPVLKAQHPEFEMYSQGAHARAGVACVDCHMPYQRIGAAKVTDHQVRSPLLNVSRACLTCHKATEGEMRARVETIQTRHLAMRNLAMDALVELVRDLEAYGATGPTPIWEKKPGALEWKDSLASDPAVKTAREEQRKAQFLLDFVEAENSNGFHAPQEAARLLTLSIDHSRKGQAALRPLVRAAGTAGHATGRSPSR